MTYEEWGQDKGRARCVMMYADWTEDRKQLKARIAELEAFLEPIRRAYEEGVTTNTVQEEK